MLVNTGEWRRASSCDTGNCVEVQYGCDAGQCVEVSTSAGMRWVRDSKGGTDSGVLMFTEEEWQAFITGVKAGEFD